MQEPEKHRFESFDYDRFEYLKWSNSTNPKTVIIAVHGINGAAQDYHNLATYLISNQSSIALCAPETRGQGNDLNYQRRGDIYKGEEWFKDLVAFTKVVRNMHPEAEVIWCGESMGSIIVTHTYANYPIHVTADRIILLAPVVSLKPHLPDWKFSLAKIIAYLLPNFRVSLNQFSGDQAVKVTQGNDNHNKQAITNSYFIESFSLRLLSILGHLIQSMPQAVSSIHCPVLMLNGGHDYFTPSPLATDFYSHIPQSHVNRHAFFPDSYHLLMYDNHKEQVFEEIAQWLVT